MVKDIDYDFNYIPHMWVSIHCESKIGKQDLQSAES